MTSCDCGDCDVCAPYWEDTFPDDDYEEEPHSPFSEEVVCSDCGEECEGDCKEREEREAKEEAEDMQRILDKLAENVEKVFGKDPKNTKL